MTKIDPRILVMLRKSKGWTQDQLADKTRMDGLPKIDKQTISRLERGYPSKTRSRTVEQLARALTVEPEVLTGERPLPETRRDPSAVDSKSQFNVRVGTAARNALSLVARRYRVEAAQIVELAPFLFLWAAEESLRQRRQRAEVLSAKLGEVQAASQHMPHLKPDITLFPYSEDAIAAENESIEKRDLFGSYIDLDLSGLDPNFDAAKENPFAAFLTNIVEKFGEVAKFEEWSEDSAPRYRICPDEAAEIVGGNRDRAQEILHGLVSLSEMPKDIRKQEMTKERAEWVRVRADEHRKQLVADLKDLELFLVRED